MAADRLDPDPPAAPAGSDEGALASVRAALDAAGIPAATAEVEALVPAFGAMRARVLTIEATLEAAEPVEPAATFLPGTPA